MISECTLLLTLSILLGCNGRYGGQKMVTASPYGSNSNTGDGSENGSLGLTFIDTPSSEYPSVYMSRLAEPPPNDNAKRILKKELDADGNLTQGNNNDLLRRIEHLLEDISASTHPLRVQHNERPESTSLPYGVNSNDALNGHAIGSYATSSSSVPFSSEIEQSQPNMAPIDADTVVPAKSRKSNGFLGVVWPAGGGRASGPSSSISPTSFYPVPWVSRKGSTGVLSSASPAVRTILSNGLSGSGSGTLVGPKSQSVASARHHRIGAEEVVLRSPIHLSNDYGWKRVENSRWNNLRGMWGKRGIETKNVFSANKFKGFAEVPTNKVHNGQPNRL